MTDPAPHQPAATDEREPMSIAEEIAKEVRDGLDVPSH